MTSSISTLVAYRNGSVYRFNLDRELRTERSLARAAGEVTVEPQEDAGCTVVVPVPAGHDAARLVLIHSVTSATPVFVQEVTRRDDAFVVQIARLKGYRFPPGGTVTVSYCMVEREA